jgi:GntR family transcriptional regulator/MocR family aminotransferase
MNELTVRLDKNAPEPLFGQLYAFIRQEIISGRLVRNEKLPSKRRLAASLQCSQNTVQAAYSQLTDEGYLVARAKSGFYVAALDGIVNIGKAREDVSGGRDTPETYRFDFSHQGVDFGCFPFPLWRKLAWEAVNAYDGDLMRTGDPQGYPGLRAGIARYLRHSRGVSCLPDQVVVSSGTEYLLQLLIQLFDDSAVYAIENPGYERLPLLFRSSRAEFRTVPLDEYGMMPAALGGSGADVAVITPSHQFPTGRIMPVSRRVQLLGWANEKEGRYVVEDDYDSEFRYSGKPIPSLQGLDRQGRVIYLGAFSKSLTPALRVSYMVLPEQLLRIYRERLDFYICPVPTVEQKILQRFIDEGHFERHLNRTRNLYKQKRETLVSAIRDMLPGAEVEGAAAGLHITLRLHNGMSEGELIQRAKENRVRVYGLSRYYSGPAETSDGSVLLLGFATLNTGEIPEAVSVLRKSWDF